MAITHFYVDPSIAADSGTGTIGDPYGDLEYCLATATAAGSGGNQINVKAGTAEVLTSSLDIASFLTTAETNRLTIRGYTSAADDGGQAEIDCNSNSLVSTTTLNYINLINLDMHSFGSAEPIHLGSYCLLYDCSCYTSTHTSYILDMNLVCQCIGCYFYGHTGVSNIAVFGNYSIVRSCFFDLTGGSKNGVYMLGTGSRCVNSIVTLSNTGAFYGIRLGGIGSEAQNCSIYNAALGTGEGIYVTNHSTAISSCIAEGFNGTTGNGIRSNNETGSFFNNRFYACAANIDAGTNHAVLNEDNSTLAASAFADPDNDDFTVSAEVQGGAVPAYIGGVTASPTFLDFGACQREEPAGGGVPGNTQGGMQ